MLELAIFLAVLIAGMTCAVISEVLFVQFLCALLVAAFVTGFVFLIRFSVKVMNDVG